MTNEIIFYSTSDGDRKIEIVYQDENFWLTQKSLSGLFDVKVPAVSKHLKNIFESGELVADSVVSILETTAADGKTYKTKYYNFDAIIAVGYRVNSIRGTQFCIWATQRLREYIIKGFALDDEQLKEAVRSGFKKAWQESNYGTIIAVARKMQEKVLHEDPKLLMWYDQAMTRTGGE